MAKGRFVRTVGILLSCILMLTCASQIVFSASTTIEVYYNDNRIDFGKVQPVMKDGRTLVPFRKIFETLGFEVEWFSSGGVQKAIGEKVGLTIELTINQKNAKVNGKTVQLDVPAQIVEGNTMVPLRFVSENSGYEVGFASSGGVSTIRIGPPGSGTGDKPGASADAGTVEPYVVKGRVTDGEGRPVKGAEVFADNQLLYNSNLVTVTDADGNYRIELPLLAATWNMGGTHKATIDGKTVTADLIPEVDEPFAGNTGAIRDFTFESKKITGELYLYMELMSFVNGYMENDVEVTLTPIGGGKTITGKGYNFPGGFGMNDVPVGRYKITAVYMREGEDPLPLLVRVRNKGDYKESVELGFTTLTPGIEQAEIEFRAP